MRAHFLRHKPPGEPRETIYILFRLHQRKRRPVVSVCLADQDGEVIESYSKPADDVAASVAEALNEAAKYQTDQFIFDSNVQCEIPDEIELREDCYRKVER